MFLYSTILSVTPWYQDSEEPEREAGVVLPQGFLYLWPVNWVTFLHWRYDHHTVKLSCGLIGFLSPKFFLYVNAHTCSQTNFLNKIKKTCYTLFTTILNSNIFFISECVCIWFFCCFTSSAWSEIPFYFNVVGKKKKCLCCLYSDKCTCVLACWVSVNIPWRVLVQ